jgi:hypothetical protein
MSPDDSKTTPFWATEPLVEEGEIISTLAERKGTSLFLGKYTLKEVFAVLEKWNFFKEARKRGLWPLAFDLDSSAFPLQRFQIFYNDKKPDKVIVDLKIREGVFSPDDKKLADFPLKELKCLIFEWLTLQNPLEAFSTKHGALPGQQHPGLSMGKKVMDVFIFLGKLTHKDALLAFPAYYHNAVLFSRRFRFLNPEKEGEVQAIRRTFSHVPIKLLAWIVHLNCLRTERGVYEWKAEEQVFPLAKELKGYFDSKRYREIVKDSLKKFHFWIDWEDFKRKESADGG